MIINEFEVGNSTSSQEKAMEEGRNLLEEFKTPSPEKVKNGTTEEEIIDLRKSVTFFYNHNEQLINYDIEVGHWSRIAAKNAFHQDHKSLVINYPIITNDNQSLVSNPLEIMKSQCVQKVTMNLQRKQTKYDTVDEMLDDSVPSYIAAEEQKYHYYINQLCIPSYEGYIPHIASTLELILESKYLVEVALLVNVRKKALRIVNPWMKNSGVLIAYLTLVLELLHTAATIREVMKQGNNFKCLTTTQDKNLIWNYYILVTATIHPL